MSFGKGSAFKNVNTQSRERKKKEGWMGVRMEDQDGEKLRRGERNSGPQYLWRLANPKPIKNEIGG